MKQLMAPSKPSGRNKREADYSNIGVAGRKTGVTLKDTGIRDEHGLEPLDGIFSSPEKSPAKRNGAGHSSTIEEEEEMDIGQSTIPDPTEVLSARRNGKPILPPPKARSPLKTTLNSSPRRSVGPMSSPTRRNNPTPARAASHPLVNRKLDFSMEKPRHSIETSPHKSRSVFSLSSSGSKSGKLRSMSGKTKKRPFDLGMEDEDEEVEDEEIEGERMMEGSHVIERLETFMNGGDSYDGPGALLNGNDSLHLNGEDVSNIGGDATPPEIVVEPKRKAGRPPKNASVVPAETNSVDVKIKPVNLGNNKKRGRRPKHTAVSLDEVRASNTEIEPSEEPVSVDADEPEAVKEGIKPRKVGRPKKSRSEANRDEGEEVEAEPSKPAKRPKLSSVDSTPLKSKRKSTKPPPSKRDPKAKVTAAKSPEANARFTEPNRLPLTAGHRPGPRSLFLLRSETPAEDNGARITKSGRTSVKPLAFWRNERFVFGDVNLEGKNLLLPAIKEVIRTEEIVDPRPKVKRSAGRRALVLKRRRLEDLEEEEDETDQEPWELGEGVLQAEVIQWDPTSRRGDEEQIEETDLAYAPAAMQAATREVRGVDFRFTKTITLPFFGSGMVDLPPGGEKRVKNSRRMQMVFFMFYGRVTVTVAGTTFSIGKGGTWQVPRGNFYSISNPSPQPARIFFAQGCDVSELDGTNEGAGTGEEAGSGGGETGTA
ncbi:MAG: hypothetical protein Q9187_000625 [Circinaria calcarea]